jgi:hypothetical protein
MKLILAAVLGLVAAPAIAGNVPLGAFDQVQLRGGGHLTIRHGAQQAVNIVKGSTQYTSFHISEGRRLEIDACNEKCPMVYDLEVEIVTPELKGIGISGGGEVVTAGAFPAQDQLDVAVNGGGDIDMRAVRAANVDAAVRGGGDIEITAVKELNAAVSGGGSIVYHGDPQVNEAVRGGGSVSRASK